MNTLDPRLVTSMVSLTLLLAAAPLMVSRAANAARSTIGSICAIPESLPNLHPEEKDNSQARNSKVTKETGIRETANHSKSKTVIKDTMTFNSHPLSIAYKVTSMMNLRHS